MKGLIALRKAHPVLSGETFYSNADISWFDHEGLPPDWHGSHNRLGSLIREEGSGGRLYLLFNAALAPCRFALPSVAGGWRMLVDTSQSSPDDLPISPPAVISDEIALVARSAMILSAG